MEFLENLCASGTSPTQVINTLHDIYLSNWEEHIDYLLKSKDDKVAVKTVILLGTKIACDDDDDHHHDHNESESSGCEAEKEIRQVFEKQVKILSRTCRKDFVDFLASKVAAWSSPNSKFDLSKYDFAKVLLSLHSFCEGVLEKLPYLGKDILPNLICTGIGVIAATSQQPNLLQGFTSLQKKIQELNESFESDKQVVKKRGGFSAEFELFLHSKEPPQDFRRIEIVPTLKELLEDNAPFLRPNKIKGAYYSPDHYLDVQFRLLREDFVQPLRKGVEHFLEYKEEYLKPKGKKKVKNQQQDTSVRIYTGVTFHHSQKSRDAGKVYFFNLPIELVQKINWKKSKKLLPGCLIMLTSDGCETAIFATTLAPPFDNKVKSNTSLKDMDPRRAELSQGILRVSIETGDEEQLEPHLNYIMFECEAYFEAYRYNLDILQRTMMLTDTSPMRKFIVEASSIIHVPLYFKTYGRIRRDEPRLLLPFKASVYGPLKQNGLKLPSVPVTVPVNQQLSTQEWPDSLIKAEMGLDDNQYDAYKTALTSELSVIQGPPGTGKTFIGLHIVKTLLLNKIGRQQQLHINMPRLHQNVSVGVINPVVPNSPILILCYTNHALDQFLELLLTEIKDLDLIRVGGQCKSEILKRHSLQEKRRWVEMRRSGENSLYRQAKFLEGELSLVRNEIGELEDPCGIFNFGRSGSQLVQSTVKKLPTCLCQALQSGDWLGIPEQVESTEDVELKEMILGCMDDSILQVNTIGLGNQFQEAGAHDGVDDKGYDEDYDMDELLEHRLEDDYYKNCMESDASDEAYRFRYYLPNCSSIGCRWQAKKIEKEFHKASKNEQSPDYLDYEYDKKYSDYSRRAKFLTAIFDLHHHGQLQLPNVDNFLYLQEEPTVGQGLLQEFLGDDEFFRDNQNEVMDNPDRENDEQIVENYIFVEPNREIDSFSMRERWALYFKVVDVALNIGQELLEKKEEELQLIQRKLKEERQYLDGLLLSQANIIGMTTTGAAKNHFLLEIAKPRIVVIEEAAEILEAHIITSLTVDCEQLILIGDHLQLRPSTNVYQLGHKYHMNVSLFERMILNNINLCTLKTQHRMRPEIADLIVGPIYSQLYNHKKVLHYPQVKGITKNLFFLTHSQLENTDTELLSKSNSFEAHFISGLCDYLLQQGYSPSQITILTTYTGQMFLIKKVISATCFGVRITCVDNYQGEENDIILLSLVRSNQEDKIGFVGIDNRICVSLSRAKHGMFIVGNLGTLIKTSQTWKQIGEKLEAGGNCGDNLELICAQHGNKTKVSQRSHFAPLKLGGCGLKCDTVLECAHRCPLYCHPQDHSQYQCNQRCEKRCEFDHQCLARCFQKCPPCQTQVMKMLPCGHELRIRCSQNPLLYPCPVVVKKELKCQLRHEQELPCHVNVSTIKCQVPVEKTMPRCGHTQTVNCDEPTLLIKCEFMLDHILEICKHTRRVMCWQRGKAICVENCKKILHCGHECVLKCHVQSDPDHKMYVCRELECKSSCVLGHPCVFKHRCYGKCPPCQVSTLKKLECGHEVELPCSKNSATHFCMEKVKVILVCGHEQMGRCGRKPEDYNCKAKCEKLCGSGHSCGGEHACHEKCPPCQTPVVKSLKCNPEHKAELACYDDGATIKCSEEVEMELECGHVVKDECHYDPQQLLCRELILKKYLDCGHERYVACFLQEFLLCQAEGCRLERLGQREGDAHAPVANNAAPVVPVVPSGPVAPLGQVFPSGAVAPIVPALSSGSTFNTDIGNSGGSHSTTTTLAASVVTKAVAAEPYDPHPQYSVSDDLTRDSKTTTESRDGDVVHEPDGAVHTVTYTADPVDGLNTVVDRSLPAGFVAVDMRKKMNKIKKDSKCIAF